MPSVRWNRRSRGTRPLLAIASEGVIQPCLQTSCSLKCFAFPDANARALLKSCSSLEETEEEVAAAWAGELERRSREAVEGLVPLEDWQTVRTRIVKELERRRAGRSSS